MQKFVEIEQEVLEIWGFKVSEMILLHETKKRKKYHCGLGGYSPNNSAPRPKLALATPSFAPITSKKLVNA